MQMTEKTFAVAGKTVTVFLPHGMPVQPVIWMHTDAAMAEETAHLLQKSLTLCCVDGVDWNRELSPWPAEKAFRAGQAFAGGADLWLTQLTQIVIPYVEAQLGFYDERQLSTGLPVCADMAFIASSAAGGSGSLNGPISAENVIDAGNGKQPKSHGGAVLSASCEDIHALKKQLTLPRCLPLTKMPLRLKVVCRMIAGYSLAGLFALYALYQSRAFCAAASMSGSLWYDGFVEYLHMHTPVRAPKGIYLSLGDTESKTANSRLCKVGECTLESQRVFEQHGWPVCFESVSGGHFSAVPERCARGLEHLVQFL